MSVPAAGEVRREAAGAFEIALLFEQAEDHRRDFTHLHVLESQLAVEPLLRRLRLRRRELVAGRDGEDPRFFRGRVARERLVKGADGVEGRARAAAVSRAEEPSQQIVQAPVFPGQAVRQGRRRLTRHRVDFFTTRDRERMDLLRVTRRRIAPLFAGLLLLAPGCRKEADPVRSALERMRKAAEARDVSGVVENLTDDFREIAGGGTIEVSQALRRYFAAYEILNLQMRDITVERAPEAARARFRVEFSGQPKKIGGLDGLLPSASAYSFDVRLVPDGSRWKVSWAAWEPVGER